MPPDSACPAIQPSARRLRFALLQRFRRDQSGANAVEFGLVAFPFLALLFAIIETALVFFAGQVLETAAQDSSRLIFTGQAQKGQITQQEFKNAVCSRLNALFDCAGGIHVDVRKYTSFAGAGTSKPVDDQGKLIEDFQFNPGGAEDIVVVRVMYEWPVRVPLLGLNLADLANGKRLLMATSTFRNEPFQ